MKKMILILFFISFFSFSGESEMVAYMKKNNSRLSEKEAKDIYKNVVRYSTEYDFDPILVFSVMKTESNFRHSTVSTAGAKGLMQLMPENFEEFKLKTLFIVEHLQEILLNTQKQSELEVIFDLVFIEKPTYDEIKSGTPKIYPVFSYLKQQKNPSSDEFCQNTQWHPH